MEDRSLEDRSLEDRSLEGRSLEDTSLEDTSLEDTSLEDRSLEDRSLEDRSLEEGRRRIRSVWARRAPRGTESLASTAPQPVGLLPQSKPSLIRSSWEAADPPGREIFPPPRERGARG